MKNPFVAMAVMAATFAAALRENAVRDHYGKNFHPFGDGGKSGHAGSKRPKDVIRSENRRRNKAARLARRIQRAHA